MTSPAKCAALVLPFFMTGCFLHRRAPIPVPTLAYPPAVAAPASLQITSVELPPAMMLIAAVPIYDIPLANQSIKPSVKRKKVVNRNPEIVANPVDATPAPVPAIAAIGTLSMGDSGDAHRQAEESIGTVEKGLSSINRTLSDTEQKTADQIRTFVKQAQTALTSGDVDGARTLAAKAKVLLDELNK